MTPQIAQAMENAFIQNPDGRKARKELTPRQREVLQLLAEGRSMKEAADILSVTARTVAFHKYRMMEGLGIKTTADLIQFAVKDHIVIS
ncbi:MAG: helix-turn-helix transcriptional regulator [Candidatus Acidiferrales bacterium]